MIRGTVSLNWGKRSKQKVNRELKSLKYLIIKETPEKSPSQGETNLI